MQNTGIAAAGGRDFTHLMRSTALGVAFSVAGLAAHAQEAPSDDQKQTEEKKKQDDDNTVVVTALAESYKSEQASPKATASLLNTPRSVTIVTEQVLKDTNATTLVEALRTVPGITMAMGEGGQPFADRPFIRGSESTSGILVDGVRDSSAQSRDVFNLEQVEVSKGANGPLAGRGAAGGSLNLVTITAKPENTFGLTLQAGNADQKRATANINRSLSDTVAARVALMYQDSGIPGRDAVFDKRWGVTPTIAFGINGRTRVDLTYTHFEGEGIIDYGHPLDTTTGQPVEGIDPDNFYGLLARDFHDTQQDVGQFEINHDLNENLTLRNLTRYSETSNAYIATNPDDSQGNVVNGLVLRNTKSNNSQNETFSSQTDLIAKFSTGGVKHSVATGAEYTEEETVRATYAVEILAPGDVSIPRGGCDLFGAGAASGYNCTDLYNPNPNDPWSGAISLNAPTTTKAETVGLYALDTITLSEKWLLNLGVRWDDFSTDTSTGLSNDADFVTYQAGLVYKPTENSSLYASYATSASPSGVTVGDGGENISTTNEDLKPEHSKNYELGAKWELFKRKLALDASIFRTDTLDSHVAVEPGRGGAQEAIGKERVQGLELTAVGSLTNAWQITAGYSYLDSEILEAGPVNAAIEGNRMPNTPEHSFSTWTTYQVTPKFTLGGGATYMSERYGDTANTKSVDSYWRYDAMASYDFSDRIALQLNIQNLTDERYYDRVYTTHMATIAPGRSIVGTLRFSY
ncbi:MAG: TonB-dependent siderophore receptor [Hyphomonadaceae bacterium]